MEITDEMREHARASYGPAMPEFLAALQRVRVLEEGSAGVAGKGERLAVLAQGTWEDRPEVVVERHAGVVRPAVFASDCGYAASCEPASALRSAWDLIAAGDAVRFGWIS